MAISCQKDDEVRPFVNISGVWENAPDYTAGVWQVPYPDGNIDVPKSYKVYGSCDYMEDGIDPEHSFFNTSDVVWDPLVFAFRGKATMTLSTPHGDKLYMDGEFLFYHTTYYNEAYFNFGGGTGKFDGSEGWMKSSGQHDPATGHIFYDAAGKISEPKSN